MTMMIFPAQPGTNLVHKDDGVTAPIVGFAYVQGNLVFPLFVMAGKSGCGPDEAVQHPDGLISYPAKSRFFTSLGEWQEWMRDQAEEEEAQVAATGGPDKSPIKFGTTKYKTKSYWHWQTANAIFEIEGEAAIPDDPRVVKVKRDEFADLKKAGASKIDPHAGVIEDEEPAEPQTSASSYTDEDDDDGVI